MEAAGPVDSMTPASPASSLDESCVYFWRLIISIIMIAIVIIIIILTTCDYCYEYYCSMIVI